MRVNCIFIALDESGRVWEYESREWKSRELKKETNHISKIINNNVYNNIF